MLHSREEQMLEPDARCDFPRGYEEFCKENILFSVQLYSTLYTESTTSIRKYEYTESTNIHVQHKYSYVCMKSI